MYERFTDRARKVLQLADEEAKRFQHDYIGTEHILLGLVREGSGVAANVLKNLGVDRDQIRLQVEKVIQALRDHLDTGDLHRPPGAKKALEYAMEEARHLHHNYVGTEHLLLGLIREQEGVAAHVLMNLGLELGDVREEVLNLLGHSREPSKIPEPEPVEEPREMTVRFRRALWAAQDETRRLKAGFVDTEHLLLGLLRDEGCVAVQVLKAAGEAPDVVRSDLEKVAAAALTEESPTLKGTVPQTAASQRVLALARGEARYGEHLGTEHLLLALLQVPEGRAAEILGRFGMTIGRAREAYGRWLSRETPPPAHDVG